MEDLRIVDAPEIPTEDITGEEKLPTGGSGNYSITLDSVADYTKTKKDLADNTSVDNKVGGVRQELNTHVEDLLNPHQVTKGQIGLGNVDNTADADKPVSNSTQVAITSAVAPKSDKTYVDNQLEFKANKVDVYTKSETYTKQESDDLVGSNISTALNPINSDLGLAKRGVINTFNNNLSYNTNDRVVLTDGGFVVSTIDGNTNNPNIDMTGWFVPYMRGSQNLVELVDKVTSRSNLDVYSKSEALAKDSNLSELTDVTQARNNINVYSKTESLGSANNLSELTDLAQARSNLDVYSKSEALAKDSNLSELTDTATARTNLGVYSKAETDNIAATPEATELVSGKAKIATSALVGSGTNDTDFITPKKFSQYSSGFGQSLVNVTASRVLGVTYTNPTDKTIYIRVLSTRVFNTLLDFKVTIDGKIFDSPISATGSTAQAFVEWYPVPPRKTYKVENGAAGGVSVILSWWEYV